MAAREQNRANLETVYVPPTARGAVAELYNMPWLDRVRLFLSRPDPETIERLLLGAFQSFTPERAFQAISEGWDILPATRKEMWADFFLTRPWVKKIIRRNWLVLNDDGTREMKPGCIRYYLVGRENIPDSGPPGILSRMGAARSWLAPVFSSHSGWAWLVWTSYTHAKFFAEYARVDRFDSETIQPPRLPNPLRGPAPGPTK